MLNVNGEEMDGTLQMYEVPALVDFVHERETHQPLTDIVWPSCNFFMVNKAVSIIAACFYLRKKRC
jgi:hypothetical protein